MEWIRDPRNGTNVNRVFKVKDYLNTVVVYHHDRQRPTPPSPLHLTGSVKRGVPATTTGGYRREEWLVLDVASRGLPVLGMFRLSLSP